MLLLGQLVPWRLAWRLRSLESREQPQLKDAGERKTCMKELV